jgi:hypothetical protein
LLLKGKLSAQMHRHCKCRQKLAATLQYDNVLPQGMSVLQHSSMANCTTGERVLQHRRLGQVAAGDSTLQAGNIAQAAAADRVLQVGSTTKCASGERALQRGVVATVAGAVACCVSGELLQVQYGTLLPNVAGTPRWFQLLTLPSLCCWCLPSHEVCLPSTGTFSSTPACTNAAAHCLAWRSIMPCSPQFCSDAMQVRASE